MADEISRIVVVSQSVKKINSAVRLPYIKNLYTTLCFKPRDDNLW